MDEKTVSKIFDQLTEMKVMISNFMGKQEEKEKTCAQHLDKTNDHDARIRALELVQSSAAGSVKTSTTWRDTLTQAVTTAATVAATVLAIRST